MELTLKRDLFGSTSTGGQLYIDGVRFCFTLEDKQGTPEEYTGKKVNVQPGSGICVPKGRYKVVLEKSKNLQRVMPSLYGIKGTPEGDDFNSKWQNIRMHGGNTEKDTKGCILIAKDRISATEIRNSAETGLVNRLRDVEDEEIFITIQ